MFFGFFWASQSPSVKTEALQMADGKYLELSDFLDFWILEPGVILALPDQTPNTTNVTPSHFSHSKSSPFHRKGFI